MNIHPMCASDVPQVAALEAETFSRPWDEAALLAELENPLSRWLVAAEGERVLGYVGAQTAFEDADILNLCVAPGARGRGIGRALMRALETLLAGQGAERLTLEVRASNAPAVGLYTALGYAKVGLRRGYYERPREDALILQKPVQRPEAGLPASDRPTI